ncbi:hypothetical protein MAV101_15265 [Mycobacterium avium subsp. hominissuis 101]|uniref:Uncharacterized protein n=1 Tax=Mycobacterium avium (strain 104) TaxID=243243 RepID=A0A0H2ZTB5_MYCA1|nr:hypothetical protein MAV_3041 [Mycobacterium avium 104]ANR93800.1 hypothetical protein BBJ32_22500 [Mycobacterium avium]ETA97078.1 hypothetical protein O982_14360 [Mycobacterium avium 10-5581]ETB16184.1 hypothetical protein O972_13700 [Mycobacterium avium subsp. avium 10-9275]ETB20620.1 hypothetical protein O973_13155 [Mycobacterium avium subsp. avium 11-4751]ETB38660.1 hypothetical protein O974_27035 [Mycobacterium avium 11-0986]EUA37862.1 hypothetical protein I549_3263 [Mycobacterium avi
MSRIGYQIKCCAELVNRVFDYRSQQTIAVAEVMLDDTPTEAGSFDDVPCTSRGEAFLANAPDRLVDE